VVHGEIIGTRKPIDGSSTTRTSTIFSMDHQTVARNPKNCAIVTAEVVDNDDELTPPKKKGKT